MSDQVIRQRAVTTYLYEVDANDVLFEACEPATFIKKDKVRRLMAAAFKAGFTAGEKYAKTVVEPSNTTTTREKGTSSSLKSE